MSVLINGMEMPKTCGVCPLFRDDFNDYCMAARSIFLSSSIKPDWCPLVPLPEGHGRLGDLDAIVKRLNEMEADFDKKEFYQGACWFHVIAELLKKAPTVIEAEGGNADG